MDDAFKKRKRKAFYLLINPNFQLRLVAYFTTMLFISVVLLWATVFIVLEMGLVWLSDAGVAQDVLKKVLGAINYFYFLEAVVILGMGTLLSLVASRQIIGPLYRIEQDLKSFNANPEQVREIRIRRKDYFQGLVNELNRLIEALRKPAS